MNQIRLLFLFTIVAGSLGATQTQPSNTPAGVAPPATAMVNPEAQSASIRILTPVSGQMVASNFINLRFELERPAPSGEPIFLVQLDGADPINTTSTDYTFAELQPGLHSVRVTLVDANNSPIQGGSATVEFKVPSATAQPAHTGGPRGVRQHTARTIAGVPPVAPIPPELRNNGDVNLPLAGSPLPLLSLIGFGLLIGGAAQTMRWR